MSQNLNESEQAGAILVEFEDGERRPQSPTSSPNTTTTQESFLAVVLQKTEEEMKRILETQSSMKDVFTPENAEILESERFMLNVFLNEVRNSKPPPLRHWSALQHFVYYIYRHAISSTPCNRNTKEVLPPNIRKKIRELIESLMQEDTAQLYIRLVTLSREYVLVARAHYEHIQSKKLTHYLISLMSYYGAFCAASSKLASLLSEFDLMIMERFNVNWLCLTKFIFYHHFYLSSSVQLKLPQFAKFRDENKSQHKSLFESYTLFSEDMSLVADRWISLRTQISVMSQERALNDPTRLSRDWATFEEHKKILKTNYWMIRSSQAILTQDMSDLDAHILCLATDVNNVADLLTDAYGHCLCEDCLSAEFRSNSTSAIIFSSSVCRLITCYICQEPIALDALVSHIVAKHHDCTVVKPTRVFLTPHQRKSLFPRRLPKPRAPTESAKPAEEGETYSKFNASRPSRNGSESDDKDEGTSCKVAKGSAHPRKHRGFRGSSSSELQFSTIFNNSSTPLFEPNTEPSLEPFAKFASAATSESGCHIFKGKTDQQPTVEQSLLNQSDESNKLNKNAFAEFLSKSQEVPNTEEAAAAKSTCDCFTNTDFDQKYNFTALATPYNVQESDISSTESIPNLEKKTITKVEAHMLEVLCNSNNSKLSSTLETSTIESLGAAYAEGDTDHQDLLEFAKTLCRESCDSRNESRKCCCAYCDVFPVEPPHTTKSIETRKRLRIRLHQRKEKIFESLRNATVQTDAKFNTNAVNLPAAQSPRVPEVSQHVPPPLGPAPNPPSAPEQVPAAFKGTRIRTLRSGQSLTFEPSNLMMGSISQSNSSLNSENVDSRDINALLNYIEGTKTVDKVALAEKKAAKKARQREKKTHERERVVREKRKKEEEERLREDRRREEERQREEERLREERRAAEEKKRKKEEKVKMETVQQKLDKNKKKEGKKMLAPAKTEPKHSTATKKATDIATEASVTLGEEKIPAMVTIKRSNSLETPTVTITLRGSTPETEKLLLSFVKSNKEAMFNTEIRKAVNEHAENNPSADYNEKTNNSEKIDMPVNATKSNEPKKKKKKRKVKIMPTPNINVAIAVEKPEKKKKNKPSKVGDPAVKNALNAKGDKKKNDTLKPNQNSMGINTSCVKEPNTNVNIPNLPNFRLPPGITITKIEGPPTSRNCRTSNPHHNENHPQGGRHAPMSKSGVIVVDTEKLIQQSITAINNKKNRKKNKKKRGQSENVVVVASEPEKCEEGSNESNVNAHVNANIANVVNANLNDPQSMVTLKNPIFHTLQTTMNPNHPTAAAAAAATTPTPDVDASVFPGIQQASIIKNDNGMVTIRSPRLQNQYENASSMSNFLSDLKPMYGPEIVPPSKHPFTDYATNNNATTTGWNPHEILSGLPGIEITKVQRNEFSYEQPPIRRLNEPAQVSIIPTNNNSFFSYNPGNSNTIEHVCSFDEYSSVDNIFKPRDDVPDANVDVDDKEVEAFKRFCLQSVPLEHKKKVAHLNINDIIFRTPKE